MPHKSLEARRQRERDRRRGVPAKGRWCGLKCLALGDLHLGAGADYCREPGQRLLDQWDVLDRIAAVAREEQVDLVLIAGDVFDRPRPTPLELLAFQRFLHLLAPIEVVSINGNSGHDLDGTGRPCALELFRSESTVVSREPTVETLSGVAVATLPSVPVARLVAARDGGDRDRIHADAADYLVEIARGLREQIPAGTPSILLAHWSVSGAALPNGLPVDQLREPVLPLDDLEALGFDAIVLGHIHKSQTLYGESRGIADEVLLPAAFYVGSPMPLNFGEQNDRHGVVILDLTDGSARHVPVESRRFVTVDADLTDPMLIASLADQGASESEVIEGQIRAADLADAIIRIRYRATDAQHRRVDHAALRTLCLDGGAHKVHSIQPDVIRDDRARVAGLDETIDELGALYAYIEAQGLAGDSDRMRERTRAYLEDVRA